MMRPGLIGKKISDLEMYEIDYWVAITLNLDKDGSTIYISLDHRCYGHRKTGEQPCAFTQTEYRFSSDHAQGGPLIDRYLINCKVADPAGYWVAWIGLNNGPGVIGTTRLIAAMRALLAHTYGEYVPPYPAVRR